MKPGTLLLNRYRVIGTLGEGGFSKVVKALDTKTEREVAVKVIPASKKTAARALREAKTVALLNHPNIVTLYEFEETEDNYYLIMEYVDGRSLEEILSVYGRLPADMAIAVTAGVCEAMEYAHANDVIHRDIKPANLMVLDDGRTKVMDFGIARLMSAPISSTVTNSGDIVGTFAYMSPEQCAGERIDGRSDIFSAGVLLYQMVAGCLPFESDTPAGTIQNILNEDPIPPSRFNDMVPPPLEHFILKALAKDPQDRFGSAEEFKDAIERYLPAEETPTGVIRKRLPELRPPETEQALGPVAAARTDFRKWAEEHRGTIKTTALALSCAIVAAWSNSHLPFLDISTTFFVPILIFFLALFFPSAGLAAVFGIIAAGLWHVSTYVGILSLVILLFYWIILGRSFPHVAVLPFLTPALAWLNVPYLFPLMMGLMFGPLMAAALTLCGALILAGAEFLGHVDYGWVMSIRPELIAATKFTGEVEDAGSFFNYFLAQPWLMSQIAIWSGVAFFMGLIKMVETESAQWWAIILGAATIFFSYRILTEMRAIDYDLAVLLNRPLFISAILATVLTFIFIHPRKRSL